MLDRSAPEAECHELPRSYESMLAHSQVENSAFKLRSVTFTLHIKAKVTRRPFRPL